MGLLKRRPGRPKKEGPEVLDAGIVDSQGNVEGVDLTAPTKPVESKKVAPVVLEPEEDPGDEALAEQLLATLENVRADLIAQAVQLEQMANELGRLIRSVG